MITELGMGELVMNGEREQDGGRIRVADLAAAHGLGRRLARSYPDASDVCLLAEGLDVSAFSEPEVTARMALSPDVWRAALRRGWVDQRDLRAAA